MKKIYALLIIFAFCSAVKAQSCNPGTAKAQLDINNVNTTILGTGDMWWDLASAKYEVPKGGGASSMFAGSLWIGGLDAGGQLHTSAMTYRQNGVDFWPGPLDTVTATTDNFTCNMYDRIWKVDRQMVADFRANYKNVSYIIPKDILEWPGNGDVSKGQAKNLAPYVDVNGDGYYNPHDGDYPAFNFTGIPNCNADYLLGDQTLWYIYNDKGNTHGETRGLPFGVEIQTQAFAYKSLGDIGNMTFYQHKIINRSANTYHNVYIGQWADFDLGLYSDDHTQCDVKRGLGIGYNGDSIDGSGTTGTYGKHPPAIGIDFLGGPKAYAGEGKDSYGTSFVDSAGRIQMAKFVYYTNDFTVQGNPVTASGYYNYLRGMWLDTTAMTYGGAAKGGSTVCDFMFPDNTDPSGLGTGGIPQPRWSEETAGNIPDDRRFLMSAGPFTMKPGDVQIVTIGVVWARDYNGTNLTSIDKLKQADDVAQKLYNHCFDTSYVCPMQPASMTVANNYLSVNLTCPASGATYSWNFGDGISSSSQNPSHTYVNPGKYIISLKVSYPCGSDSTSQTITVYNSPKPLGVQLQRMEGQGNGGWMIDMMQESEDSVFTNPTPRVMHPIYKSFAGPVYVDVLDSSLLPNGKFAIAFSDTTKNATWKLFEYGNSGLSSDTVYSTSSVSIGNYQVIPKWGLAIQAKYVTNPTTNIVDKNGFIEASMEFSDPSKNWLTGLSDKDTLWDNNWIRSGKMSNVFPSPFDDYVGIDDNEAYEKVLGGTWAPYRLCAYTDGSGICTAGPAFDKFITQNDMRKTLASVDIILTSDKTKWTRCPVIELSESTGFSQGGARKMDLRSSASVDQNGILGDGITISTNPTDPGYIAATGLGWFPGYAINLETGERLNMAFGEDSGQPAENGRDMIWKPTSDVWSPGKDPIFGGKHYIYLFAHTSDQTFPASDPYLPNSLKNVPRYDGGSAVRQLLNTEALHPTAANKYKKCVYGDAMWVNIPLLNPGHTILESDVKIRLRVAQKYRHGLSASGGTTLAPFAIQDTIATPFNKNNPLYNFSKGNITTSINMVNAPVINVSVFPNPFDNATTFVFDGNTSEVHQLAIYDITGRQVHSFENIREKQFTMQRGNMSSGIYFYHVTTADGKSRIGKLILK